MIRRSSCEWLAQGAKGKNVSVAVPEQDEWSALVDIAQVLRGLGNANRRTGIGEEKEKEKEKVTSWFLVSGNEDPSLPSCDRSEGVPVLSLPPV